MIEYALPPLAYLAGSLSSAIIIARLLGLKDPRSIGSGNPGATNILRYGGKRAAAMTLLGDVLKGVVPVLIARALTEDTLILSLVMLAAYLGHLYPVFFRFQGGKGVATALGVWLALNPWFGLAVAATWLVTALISRYSSLSALVAATLAPVYVWVFERDWFIVGGTILITGLLYWRHRANIHRLATGQESKIGQKTA